MIGFSALPGKHGKNIYSDMLEYNYDVKLSFILSGIISSYPDLSVENVLSQIIQKRKETFVSVKKIKLNKMDEWLINKKTGNISHESGKFFDVMGLSIKNNDSNIVEWQQPIINQPEIGILGIIVEVIDEFYAFCCNLK